MDQKTESVKVTVEGRDIDLDSVQKIMKDGGASIHSIDEVVVEKSPLPSYPRPRERDLTKGS